MTPLNILYLAEHLDRSEIHTFKGMAEAGHRIRVLTPERNLQAMREAGDAVEVIDIPFKSRMDRTSIEIIKQQAQDSTDIVHCLRNNRPIANAVQALKRSKIPLIAYRGTAGHLSYFDPGSRLTYLNRRVNHLICVSGAVHRYLQSKRIPEHKLSTIYKGHDPSWYLNAPAVDILPILGRAPHEFMLGFAGRMRHLKAADLIVKSASLIAQEPPMDYLLVGEIADPQIQDLAIAYEGPHGIHLPGFRTDAPALIRHCDAFIMPTRDREGLPRAVIEAMCQGIPAIVTEVGGMPELVRHEQEGLVIPPNDGVALAQAVERMRDDHELRVRCGEAAKKRIETEFNIRTTVEKTEALYYRLRGN